MKKRRKRRKRKHNSSIPQNQTYVDRRAATEIYSMDPSGIPLKKERHTLSREADFLNLLTLVFKDKPVHHSEGTLADKKTQVLRDKAEYVINDWNCDWEAVAAHHAKLGAAYKFFDVWDYKCAEIYNDFSYQKMGLIYLYKGFHTDKNGTKKQSLFIENGNHRSLSLACLLLQGKIEWQPIPYWLWTIEVQVPNPLAHR